MPTSSPSLRIIFHSLFRIFQHLTYNFVYLIVRYLVIQYSTNNNFMHSNIHLILLYKYDITKQFVTILEHRKRNNVHIIKYIYSKIIKQIKTTLIYSSQAV